MAEVFYKDDSYKIVGVIIEVFKTLGYGYQEKYYYRAIKLALLKAGLKSRSNCLRLYFLMGNQSVDIIWIF